MARRARRRFGPSALDAWLVPRWATDARERADSELHALWFGLPLGPHGALRFRKWLGWALFRLAVRVNPEVADL